MGLNDQFDITKENNPWWHERINYLTDIHKEDIRQNVVVAVIDTGTDNDDFPYTNIIQGYNAIDGSNNTGDKHGHGKVISHLIASPKLGVNPYATILPVKVRKTMIDNPKVVSKGIKWSVDYEADIINLSLGREPTKDSNHQEYRKGVEYALKKKKVLIALSGTNGKKVFYPAAIEGVISVGGLDKEYNYNSKIDVEDIDIFSVDTKKSVSSSFPTAMVSGAVSLIMSLDESISSQEAMNIILDSADIIKVNGKNAKLLNIDKAIEIIYKSRILKE